jgi:hypothetical protein
MLACPFGVVNGTNNEIVLLHAPLSWSNAMNKRTPKYDEP